MWSRLLKHPQSSSSPSTPLRDDLYLAPGDSSRRPLSTRRRRSKSPERRRRRSRDYHSDNEATRHDRPDERDRGLRPVRTRSNKRASTKQVPSPTRIDRVSHRRVPSPPRLSFPYAVPPPPPVPYAMPPPPPIPDMVPKGNSRASDPRRASPPPPLPVIIDPPGVTLPVAPKNDYWSSRPFRVSPPPPPTSPPTPPVMAPALPVPPSAPVRPSPPPFSNHHSYPWARVSSSEDDEIKPEESASRPRHAPPPPRPASSTWVHRSRPASSKRVPSPRRPTHRRPTRRSDPVLPLRHPPTLNKLVSAPRRPSPPPVIDADPSSVQRESSNRTTPTTTPQVSHRSLSPSNRPSVVKQTPSPPPDDRCKSFPATPQAHTSIRPSKGYRPMSLQVPFPISGGFPTPPDTVRPDDSRSVASQPTSEMRPWSRSAGSLALSGSTSRPPPPSSSLSSGILGIKAYQYVPLGEKEFRLVRILPARSSKIKCEIIHASIEDAPEFVSISYAWGDA